MQELENENVAMLSILHHLQVDSTESALQLLYRIRAAGNGDIKAMSKCIEREETDAPGVRTLSNSSSMEIDEPDEMQRKLSCATTLADYSQSPSSPRGQEFSSCHGILGAPAGHDVAMDNVQVFIDMFFARVGIISSIFDRSQVDVTVETTAVFSGLAFVEVYNRSSGPKATTELSELAGMLAVGMMYSRAEHPETAPSIEVTMFYYNMARQGLDSAIRHDPLRATKLCALLALFNLSLHPSVAIAYTRLGFGQIRDSSIDAGTDRHTPDKPPELEHKKTLRALVYFQWSVPVTADFVMMLTAVAG